MNYREFPPPAEFADYVECVWTHRADGEPHSHRVFPDACSDLIFSEVSGLSGVGVMTRSQDFTVGRERLVLGVRFHPGMGQLFFRADPDGSAEIDTPLERRLGSTEHLEERIRLLVSSFPKRPELGMVQRASAWMRSQHGAVDMDELARLCGVSSRTLRRIFVAETGIGPKMLARTIRFRHACSLLDRGEDMTGAAVDAGYYDQAHMIADFRELGGCTPGEYVSVFSNTGPEVGG